MSTGTITRQDAASAHTLARCSHVGTKRGKALALFASKGFGQVGMRELATHLGISPGAIYHHFPSKQHLLFDIIEEFYEELLAALARKATTRCDPVGLIIGVHLDLHGLLPWHFTIAMRDSDALTADHRLAVERLRCRYYQRLLHLLDFRNDALGCDAITVAHAIAQLLNSAPCWFNDDSLNDQPRRLLLENLLRGAMERLLQSRAAICA